MRSSWLRAVLAMVMSLSLAACLNMTQEIVVKADGSADLTMAVAVAMGTDAGQASDAGPRLNCSRDRSTAPASVDVRYDGRQEAGDFVCEIRAHGSIATIAELVSTNQLYPGANSDRPLGMTLVPVGANYRLEVDLAVGDVNKSRPNEATVKRVNEATRGRSLSWSITAPRILETNGVLSADGKTASFSLPLGELLLGQRAARFSALFSLTE